MKSLFILSAVASTLFCSNPVQAHNHYDRVAQPVLTGFPMTCHWLNWKSANQRQIKLEDGSLWEVPAHDAEVIYTWRNDDALFVTPITSWFSSQEFYIANRTNNTYVKANIVEGPANHGAYSHWIVNIDPYQGHVYLENQSVWCVDPSDMYLLRDWAPDDHIMMALHDSRFSSYSYVLINANMANHVHAKQY